MHASQVCSHHSFGLPLIRMNGIHRKPFDQSHLDLVPCHLESDHACLEHLSLETFTKHSVGSKSVFIFRRCHPHSVTVVFLFSIIYRSLLHSIIIFTIIKNKSAELRKKGRKERKSL